MSRLYKTTSPLPGMNPGSGDDVCSLICKSWLLEEALGHLVEAAAPGEELVGGALRDETLGVVAGSLQTLD